VAVRVGTTLVYAHLAGTRRAPASNEKLLLSMTALSELGPDYRIRTDAAVGSGVLKDGVVHGDLWIVGHGDPEFDGGSASALAAKIRAAGIRRITGSILGDTTGFLRDREARGWHPLALDNVGLPTALSFNHNVGPSGFVMIPELDAARAVTASLRHGNVKVGGRARAAKAPGSLHPVASIQSAPLADILHRQNITSDNTDAETLCKLLGTKFGGQGSIAAGATVIHAWLHDRGIEARVMDASGLSYKDRISPLDLTKLLTSALRKSWGGLLRASLPSPGEGTLSSRLAGVAVRAKTGTLTQGISALSGYLRLRSGRTATFSILSEALGKDDAIRIEDAIVRTLAARL
jgi:D-alanyl-D-alanine carboxypeptidase/D-alanyl-D-alanine-endopeptidase (penicillin-binding protein 4)